MLGLAAQVLSEIEDDSYRSAQHMLAHLVASPDGAEDIVCEAIDRMGGVDAASLDQLRREGFDEAQIEEILGAVALVIYAKSLSYAFEEACAAAYATGGEESDDTEQGARDEPDSEWQWGRRNADRAAFRYGEGAREGARGGGRLEQSGPAARRVGLLIR
jgi:hypothetical protein